MFRSQHNLAINQLTETLFCVLLLFFMAQVSIPLKPVPITLQTLGVMIIGLKFDRRTAFYSVFTYILLGTAGFPVFASFSGGIIRPTAGYLVGCLAAVIVMSRISELLKFKYRSLVCNSLSCLAGTATIFICGVSWLTIYVGIKQAIIVGMLPFIIPGIIKIFLLVAALQYLNCTKK